MFIQEHKLENERLPLGITFSFPLRQEGLTKGILITWTKGFACEGVVGEDVVEMMRKAIKRRPVRMNLLLTKYLIDPQIFLKER